MNQTKLREPALAFGVTVAVVLLVVVWVTTGRTPAEGFSAAQPVLTEKLLIPDESLPRPSSVAESLAVLQPDHKGDPRLSHFGASESLTRAWGRAGKADAALLQEILTYRNPEEAQAEFDAVPQGRQFNDSDWGPVFEDISQLNLTAPAAAVSCVGEEIFPPGTCGRWVFRARYENHVTEVVLSDYLDDGSYVNAPRDAFLELVTAVDRHIASVLQ